MGAFVVCVELNEIGTSWITEAAEVKVDLDDVMDIGESLCLSWFYGRLAPFSCPTEDDASAGQQ